MPNKSFDLFREKHPEYPETLRRYYWESVVSCYPPVLQNSFMVDLDEPEIINQLLRLGKPEYIYCGTTDLADDLSSAFPELRELIQLHGWYEENICFVMFATKMKVPERKT